MEPMTTKEGYIIDFISGKEIKATPEEVEAVQVFSEVLVKDYGYPKEHIQTRPQWRVKVRPSDRKKEYPIDIGVFSSQDRMDSNLEVVIECKKKSRKDGLSQLKNYLIFTTARLGVWFNGNERLYLMKREEDGKVFFDEIPNIPRFGERVEDIGQFKRKDLIVPTNLKSVFRTIRNYLAANAVGITRDEVFAQQLINLIFCKIYDERFTKPEDTVSFRSGVKESHSDVKKRIVELFDRVKKQYKDVIEISDNISLDAKSITYIVGELQSYSLKDSPRDAVGDAFEIFIGPALKGGQGQFFTPRNVVKMTIDLLAPTPDDRIIDPACGSGGFLVEGLRSVWTEVEKRGAEYGWPDFEIESEKQKVAIDNFRGLDKDNFLSKVAKAYMAILGDGRGGVFCENSLDDPKNWKSLTRNNIALGSFDIVMTNPPFGKKLAIDSQDLLASYELGYKWNENKEVPGEFIKDKIQDKQPPQILFIERCFDLLKPGGKLGIVLLESTFGMPKYQYVVDYIQKQSNILAIVTLPEDLFQPHTHAKCCVVIAQKHSSDTKKKPHDIFMCDVKWCGHDSRGNPTIVYDDEGNQVLLDDIPKVAPLFHSK